MTGLRCCSPSALLLLLLRGIGTVREGGEDLQGKHSKVSISAEPQAYQVCRALGCRTAVALMSVCSLDMCVLQSCVMLSTDTKGLSPSGVLMKRRRGRRLSRQGAQPLCEMKADPKLSL